MLSDANKSGRASRRERIQVGPIPEVQGEVEVDNGSVWLQRGIESRHRCEIVGAHTTEYAQICMRERTARGGITGEMYTSCLSTTCWPSTTTADDGNDSDGDDVHDDIGTQTDDNGDRDDGQQPQQENSKDNTSTT